MDNRKDCQREGWILHNKRGQHTGSLILMSLQITDYMFLFGLLGNKHTHICILNTICFQGVIIMFIANSYQIVSKLPKYWVLYTNLFSP